MKLSKNTLGALLLIFLLGACKISKKAAIINQPSSIILQSLIADNLSENLTIVSTQNDEILLLVSYYQKENSSATWHKNYGSYEFTKDTIQHTIKENLTIDGGYIIIALVEIDSYISPDSISQILIQQYPTLIPTQINSKESKDQLKQALGDDDLLDIHYLDLTQLKQQNELKFWGINIFDEYQYRLTFEAK